ncbi:MAG: hypothetical protein A2Y07_05605 [Planctomycetes bacterium GWF2_50_10]|nr:MAG: hypothetical protein A2Y07_05605 [Planctomycetes bacterium GWF2_50_10]
MAVESASVKAEIREKAGSKQSARYRKKGLIPAVVYGHKQDALSIAVSSREFMAGLNHGSRLYGMELNGKGETLLLKDVQYDHLGLEVLHLDFMRVDLSERVTVEVSLEVKGTAKGQAEGGIVDQHMSSLEVECLVTAIPDAIVMNIKDLGVGDSIHAKDVKLPAGVTLVTDGEALVLSCHVLVEKAEEAGEEVPATPEVIGRKEKEGEEEAEKA